MPKNWVNVDGHGIAMGHPWGDYESLKVQFIGGLEYNQ